MSKSLASHSLRRAVAAILLVLPLFALLHASVSSATTPEQITYPIKINFQGDSAAATGYQIDSGLEYGARSNNLTYGWSDDISSTAVNSDSGDSPTEAHDTHLTPHNPWNGTDTTWKIDLPNGLYDVRLVVGNAGGNLSHYDVLAEGEQILHGRPINGMQWLETTAVVDVSDGQLNITRGPDGSYHRFNFIEIEPHTAPTPDYTTPIKINFQPQDSPAVSGYEVDSGMSYATRPNGYTYGWNINNAMYTLDHDDVASPDQLHDTAIDMQKWSWLLIDDFWEIELPNGDYQVRLVAGDYTGHYGYYRLDIEDLLAVQSNGWVTGQVYDQEAMVKVEDGRLTVSSGAGSANNRLNYIEITPIIPNDDPIITPGISDFLETFSSAPTAPQIWSSSDWDWTVQVGNNPTAMGEMNAGYSSDCSDLNSTHTISSLGEVVYSCEGRLQTAVNGASNGVGSNYGMAYLTPNRIISATQDFTISFDMSTVRTNKYGDWVEFWLMPYDTHLMSPTQSWRSSGQGYPEKGLRFYLNSQNYWSVELVDNYQGSNLPLNDYDSLPAASITDLSTFKLEVLGGTMKFGMPDEDIWWYWGNVPTEMSGWGDTIVSFGHHSDNPQSNCTTECGPNTWHWDNVSITPSESFAIIQPDKTVVSDSDSDQTFNFNTTAPDDDSYLRFMAVGHDIELSFNNGITWITPTLQLTGQPQDSNRFRYYWTQIPRDIDQVKVRGTNWWNGDWAVRDMSIWSQTYLWPASLDWQAEGRQSGSFAGHHANSAGDVNGDGYDDVLVGAYRHIANGQVEAGRVELYYGSSAGLELAPRWVIDGSRANGHLGYSVNTAGDLNGDGFADIVLGEPTDLSGEAGKVYIYYGSSSGLQATPTILSDDEMDTAFGYAVAPAGDVDGDGFGDLLISANRYDDPAIGDDTGRVSLYFGSDTGLDDSQVPLILTGEQAGSRFGTTIAMVGNLDNDNAGQPELAIGADHYGLNGEQDSNGRIYIYNNFDGTNTNPDWILTGPQPQEMLGGGYGLDGAGDVNNDGFDDLLIGSSGYSGDQTAEGRILVYYGSASGLGMSERLPDWQVDGQQSDSNLGWSVAGLGDMNGDGIDDIAVGGFAYDQYGLSDSGRVAVFFGNSNGLNSIPDWMAQSDDGTSDSHFGYLVAPAGDFNGDGKRDLLIGEPGFSNVEQREGRVVARCMCDLLPITPQTSQSLEIDRQVPSIGYLGHPVTYTVQVTNTDLFETNNFVVTATLPADSTYANGGTDTNGQVVWAVNDPIAPGGTIDLEFSVTATSSITGGGYFVEMVANSLISPALVLRESVSQTVDVVEFVATTLEWEDEGDQASSNFGYDTASAGDVNDDGYDDVLVSSYSYDVYDPAIIGDAGRVALYYGSPYGLEVEPRWVMNGTETRGWFGLGVNTAGDVNGDGYDDVIIGERKKLPTTYGNIYIYYGGADGLGDVPTKITGNEYSSFGHSVAPAGDIDQDGYDDVLIGEPYYEHPTIGFETGQVYIYYGSASGLDTARTPWNVVGEQSEGAFGYIVASAGDVDDNGHSDVVIGAFGYATPETGDDTGRAYVYYNFENGLSTTPDWIYTGEQTNEEIGGGYSVAGAGDINNDGYDDILIGGSNYTGDQFEEGRVMAFYGGPSGLGTSERNPDWEIDGQMRESELGWTVAGLGDVNGDNIDDIGVGGVNYSQYGDEKAGRVAIFYGSDNGLSMTPDWNMARDVDGYSSGFGNKITTAGDVDGDGFQDVLVGEPEYTNGQSREGRATTYLGSSIQVTPAVARSLQIGRVVPETGFTDTPIVYTIQVTNTNLVTATNIMITATLPSNSIYLSGGAYNNGEVSWTIPMIPAGQIGSVDFAVTASTPVTLTGGGYGAEIVGVTPPVHEIVLSTTDEVSVIAGDGWTQIETANAPAVWGEYALSYNHTTQTILLYGGNNDGWPYENETWRFTGADWQLITTTQTPNAVYGMSMVSLNGSSILFGGSNANNTALAETWLFDGVDWQQQTPASAPSARTGAAVASDGASKFWLFGGQNGTAYTNDLWLYDSSTGTWDFVEIPFDNITPNNPPPERSYSGLSYANGTLYLFGGRAPDGTPLQDYWLFNISTSRWTQSPTNTEGMSARFGHSMVYDPTADQHIVFGGVDSQGDILADIWLTVAMEDTDTPTPPESVYHTAVYNPVSGRMVIFTDGQTWTYK